MLYLFSFYGGCCCRRPHGQKKSLTSAGPGTDGKKGNGGKIEIQKKTGGGGKKEMKRRRGDGGKKEKMRKTGVGVRRSRRRKHNLLKRTGNQRNFQKPLWKKNKSSKHSMRRLKASPSFWSKSMKLLPLEHLDVILFLDIVL